MGYLFNKKNTIIGLDRFESGESNILLITGIPGSGKTTLAHQLGEKYRVEVIHTDELSIGERLNTWMKANDLKGKNINSVVKEKGGEVIFKKFLKEVHLPATQDLFSSGINKRCIIEGFSIAENFKMIQKFIIKENMSIIIIDKSSLISGLWAMKRSFKKDPNKGLFKSIRKGYSIFKGNIFEGRIKYINIIKSKLNY